MVGWRWHVRSSDPWQSAARRQALLELEEEASRSPRRGLVNTAGPYSAACSPQPPRSPAPNLAAFLAEDAASSTATAVSAGKSAGRAHALHGCHGSRSWLRPRLLRGTLSRGLRAFERQLQCSMGRCNRKRRRREVDSPRAACKAADLSFPPPPAPPAPPAPSPPPPPRESVPVDVFKPGLVPTPLRPPSGEPRRRPVAAGFAFSADIDFDGMFHHDSSPSPRKVRMVTAAVDFVPEPPRSHSKPEPPRPRSRQSACSTDSPKSPPGAAPLSPQPRQSRILSLLRTASRILTEEGPSVSVPLAPRPQQPPDPPPPLSLKPPLPKEPWPPPPCAASTSGQKQQALTMRRPATPVSEPPSLRFDAAELLALGNSAAEQALLVALGQIAAITDAGLRRKQLKEVQRTVHPDKCSVEQQEIATRLFQVLESKRASTLAGHATLR